MGEQKPKAEHLKGLASAFWVMETPYWFGENVKNSVGNDLSIDGDDVSTLGQGPNASQNSQSLAGSTTNDQNSHWVDGPEDQGKSGNRCVEGLGLAVFGCDCGTTTRG